MNLVIKLSLWFVGCFENLRLKLSFTQGGCCWVIECLGWTVAEKDWLYLMGPLV